MKRTTLTIVLYAALATLLAYSFASAIAAAGEPSDLISGGQLPSDATPVSQPVLPDLDPADFALRLYRIEQRLDKLEAMRQVSQQPCNCSGGGECTCGANCQCEKPPAVVDPVTGIKVSGPTIIQLSLQNCPPCHTWWGTDERPGQRATYIAKGWATKQVKNAYAPLYPSYRIWDGQRWYEHVGIMTPRQFAAAIGR